MWPYFGVKSSPISPKVAQKVANAVFLKKEVFQNSPKIVNLLLEFFCRELLKIAQSGHTAGKPFQRFVPQC